MLWGYFLLELWISWGIENRKFSGQEILVPGKTGQEKEIFEKFFVLIMLKKILRFLLFTSCHSYMTKDLMDASEKITFNFTTIFWKSIQGHNVESFSDDHRLRFKIVMLVAKEKWRSDSNVTCLITCKKNGWWYRFR